MEGIIVNYRGSQKTQKNNQMIITVPELDNRKKAEKLISKEVVWTSPSGKKIKGEIRAVHGNKGALRVKFEKGMPGQAIGTKVNL